MAARRVAGLPRTDDEFGRYMDGYERRECDDIYTPRSGANSFMLQASAIRSDVVQTSESENMRAPQIMHTIRAAQAAPKTCLTSHAI